MYKVLVCLSLDLDLNLLQLNLSLHDIRRVDGPVSLDKYPSVSLREELPALSGEDHNLLSVEEVLVGVHLLGQLVLQMIEAVV